ncbi:hypothetical protein V8C40DRAFT_235554 [Trichoderma camerunense]
MLCNALLSPLPPLSSSLGSSCLSSLPCRVPLHRQPLSDLQHQHQREPVPAKVGKQQQVVRSDGEHRNKESCHRHLGAKLCTCCIGTWGVAANNRRHVRVAIHATCSHAASISMVPLIQLIDADARAQTSQVRPCRTAVPYSLYSVPHPVQLIKSWN